jgi:hypothetical protein
MNYTRRPNRPDSSVYRQMRRQSLASSRGSGPRRGRGAGARGVFLLVLILAVAAGVAWMLLR